MKGGIGTVAQRRAYVFCPRFWVQPVVQVDTGIMDELPNGFVMQGAPSGADTAPPSLQNSFEHVAAWHRF